MSGATLASLSGRLAEAASDAVWRQWCALGSLPLAAGRRRASALVDPEALVLISLALRDHEHRFVDVLAWWAETGTHLLSVQRMKRLARDYPDSVRERLREFAWHADRRGADRRWRALAGPAESEVTPPIATRGKSFGSRPELIEPAALLLRLRSGFGVGAKADLLGFLLGVNGAWCSIRVIASATYYTTRALSRAAEDMALARLIHATAERPVEYHVRPGPWVDLLEIERLPEWRFWQPVYAFVADALAWAESADTRRASGYLLSSSARELVTKHRDAFTRNQIPIPSPEDYRGEAYFDAFEVTLTVTAQWLAESV